MGTSGLATKVNHQYLQAFAAALAVGGIGGLAEVGNSGSVFNPQTEVINGVSSETGMESQEILNHFLNRLPIITLKEGSRAEVYIGVPLMIPSNDEHRMDPNI
jgi:type IV secretory pathway VirB10-like protein